MTQIQKKERPCVINKTKIIISTRHLQELFLRGLPDYMGVSTSIMARCDNKDMVGGTGEQINNFTCDQKQGDQIQGDQIQGDQIQGDQIQGDQIHGDKVQGDQIQGDQIQGDKIQSDQIQGDKIQGDQIQGDKNNREENGNLKHNKFINCGLSCAKVN